MNNTYVNCKDWSWEDKLLYIKACIGEDMPHNLFCGNASHSKEELLDRYKNKAAFFYHIDGMLYYDAHGTNPLTGELKEIDIQTLRAAALEKPKRVKVEYVKVEFASDKEKAEAFIEGGLRYFTHGEIKGDMERDTIPVTRLDELLCGNAIYRRVETPVEWWEDLVEYIEKATEDSGYAESIKGERLHVEATMTREQWRNFAKIILEQEGE